ncbi:MAG: hypothetical protein V1688_00105, partial [bacterium]
AASFGTAGLIKAGSINISGEAYFSQGNVGIGTTAPAHKLEIESSSDIPLYIKNTNTGDWTHAYRALAPNLGTSQHYVFAEGGVAENTKNSAHLDFYYAGAGSNDNRLTMGLWGVDNVLNITGAGRVGIGYNSPTEALEVNGNIKASGAVDAGDGVFTNGDIHVEGNVYMGWEHVVRNIEVATGRRTATAACSNPNGKVISIGRCSIGTDGRAPGIIYKCYFGPSDNNWSMDFEAYTGARTAIIEFFCANIEDKFNPTR